MTIPPKMMLSRLICKIICSFSVSRIFNVGVLFLCFGGLFCCLRDWAKSFFVQVSAEVEHYFTVYKENIGNLYNSFF